jgi:hypothetical protein
MIIQFTIRDHETRLNHNCRIARSLINEQQPHTISWPSMPVV